MPQGPECRVQQVILGDVTGFGVIKLVQEDCSADMQRARVKEAGSRVRAHLRPGRRLRVPAPSLPLCVLLSPSCLLSGSLPTQAPSPHWPPSLSCASHHYACAFCFVL